MSLLFLLGPQQTSWKSQKGSMDKSKLLERESNEGMANPSQKEKPHQTAPYLKASMVYRTE
jgi:hypothetical protein